MTNQYPRLYSIQCLLTIAIIHRQFTILTLAQQQPTQYKSAITSNISLNHYRVSTSVSTILLNDDETVYDGDNENSEADIYEDVESLQDISSTIAMIQENIHMNSNNNKTDLNEYHDDDVQSYQDIANDDDDDGEDNDDHIFADTMSINRPESKRPIIIDTNNRKHFVFSSTSQIPFVPTNFWQSLFSKPAILVGIVGGVVVGILSAILLVMFIIYRMRKKDEGSYVLDEGPRKSPSHAYTRVSSREFFA